MSQVLAKIDSQDLRAAAGERFASSQNRLHRKADAIFAVLMLAQWLLAIVLALLVQPQTWVRDQSAVNLHVILAIAFGGVLTIPTCLLCIFATGKFSTRVFVAIAQLLYSALLIGVTNGRIETHFHIFGSLAFLLLYRDWRVIMIGTVVVVFDHAGRGAIAPMSIFGVDGIPIARIVEHAAWVVFEDIVLLLGCRISNIEMMTIALREAENDQLMTDLEKRVADRTALLVEEVELRKASEAEASEARVRAEAGARAKGEFLANMSHEIRTPMTAIIGYADLLQMELDSEAGSAPETRQEYVATIKRNGDHLLNIINDVLDVAKLDAGKMTLETIATDPRQICEDVMSMMRVRARAKQLDFTLTIDPSVPKHVLSDPTRIRQILLNLVGNAVKFTAAGSVRIGVQWESTGADRGRIRFAVTDTGIGITPEQRQRLFNAFEQADGSMTRKFGGSGLGLRISGRLAELLGGEVMVQSEHGIGSVFTLDLGVEIAGADAMPASAQMLQNAEANPESLPGDYLQGVHVLLVEDGFDNQELISVLLAIAGATVEVAENGKLAVEKLCRDGSIKGEWENRDGFNIILMDMQMPEMDGYTATRLLKSKGCPIPIIALTAHALAEEREKCLTAGCDEYLTKPVDKVVLGMTVRAAVDGKLPKNNLQAA